MIPIRFIFFVAIIFQISCGTVSVNQEPEIPKVIRSADVLRDVCQNGSSLPLYQGNGQWGCMYGAYGLHDQPGLGNPYGDTEFLSLKHYVRAKYNADYLLPLAKIYWSKLPEKPQEYSQHQSFHDGTVSTKFATESGKINITTWFDPVNKSLAGYKMEVEKEAPDVIIEPFGLTKVHYNQELLQTAEISAGAATDEWKISLRCGEDANATMFIRTNAVVKAEDNRLHLLLKEGVNEILISVNEPIKVNATQSLKSTINWWHNKWASSGFLTLPDTNAQKMWVRSMAMTLATFGDAADGIAPPCGFSGNAWPFYFPQDGSFSHAVLLATGQIDVAKSQVEYFARNLDDMKQYTKRLLGVDGVLCPWVMPYGSFEGYHDPVPPNQYYYEIHNSGYLARMAYETALFLNDDDWTQKYAVPIVKASAEFYKNISKKEEDGFWHLFVTPSMGQNEMGGENQKDYLCALFSAKYCLQKAIECGLDTDGNYREIADNLAFPSLLSPRGYYYSCQGSGEDDFGNEKHPVQLNSMALLPAESEISPATKIAYELRYEITADAKEPFFYGWTLAHFVLSGSKYGNVDEWLKDWNNLTLSNYVDPEWIQVYETSGRKSASYYVSSHGLIAQSLVSNLVCDWFGKLEIARCNPWEGDVYVKNISSKLGVIVSGVINGKKADLVLEAWKDTEFVINGKTIKLKKGKRTEIHI